MSDIVVESSPTAEGWLFEVTVGDEAGGLTRHRVTLRSADLERLTGGAVPPEELVRESFAFLLEREPKEAILRQFDLMVIGRYFPEYEAEIKRRLAG